MAGEDDSTALAALLSEAGLPRCGTITQTEALEQLCLQIFHLVGLPHEERPNPHNESTPMKLYQVDDAAQKALQVHGRGDLQAALRTLQELREEAAAVEQRREEVKADMAARSAERARRMAATTPAQRLCKQLGVAHDSQLPKTKAMETFGLLPSHLAGLKFQSKPIPRNPRFAPMRLYRAEEVAERALRYHTKHLQPATPSDAARGSAAAAPCSPS